MAQNYTDNIPAWGNQVDDDVEKMANNFAALKSCFSGASQPPNPVAGMWWYDTTAHILKVRNEANSAWLNVWDLANNKPIIANLSNEITLAMMAASAKSPAAGTEGLRKLGTGALDAMPGNTVPIPADGSVTTAKLDDEAVTMAKLKAPTAASTHIIARWQDPEITTTSTDTTILRGTLYVTVTGNIRVSAQLKTAALYGYALVRIHQNGVLVDTLAGGSTTYRTDYYDMAVTMGDRIDLYFYTNNSSIMAYLKEGRIYSGTSIGAVS